VDWSEVERANMHQLIFRPEDVLKRIEDLGDLFQPVLTMKQEIPEELWEESGVGKIGPAKPVQVGIQGGAATRGSKQGGRRRFVVRRNGPAYVLGIERDGEFLAGTFEAVPTGRDEKVIGTDAGAQGVNFGVANGIWDAGTYEIVEGSFDKNVVNAYFSGSKLRGEWFVAVGPEGWIWMNNGGRVLRTAAKKNRTKQ
jgi:hypothetical protein